MENDEKYWLKTSEHLLRLFNLDVKIGTPLIFSTAKYKNNKVQITSNILF